MPVFTLIHGGRRVRFRDREDLTSASDDLAMTEPHTVLKGSAEAAFTAMQARRCNLEFLDEHRAWWSAARLRQARGGVVPQSIEEVQQRMKRRASSTARAAGIFHEGLTAHSGDRFEVVPRDSSACRSHRFGVPNASAR